MITCKLYGRTGNQMFQIAATIGHALKYGYKFAFPEDTENSEIWPKVDVRLPVLDGSEKFSGYYHEGSHKYLEIPRMDNIILDGYFQSYKYFQNVIPVLLEIFHFSSLTVWNRIGLHVRRGDYLNYPDKHPVLPIEYYKKAIEFILNQDPARIYTIFVYTDDFNWCKENMNYEKFGYVVHVNSTRKPETDLSLMAQCQHNIIANSSFSYWAAMLNQNPAKIVVSPPADKWFGEGNKHLDISDLLPPSWTQIDF
jgi:hypothetical protein